METIRLKIANKEYDVSLALTEEEKEIGLQDVLELEENKGVGEGMLFIYDEPQHLDFWMKDCDLTLSIIFLDDRKIVISNQKGEPNSEDLISEDNAKYVLEVNFTDDIKPGDKALFNLGEDFELEQDTLYILGEDGTPQGSIKSGSRIFSRKSTQVMIRKAKKADESKLDIDYKDLGRYVFGELNRQENRDPEYIDN